MVACANEDNDEMSKCQQSADMMVFPLVTGSSVAQGAWKHAPIIPLPNYHALNNACSPIFHDIQSISPC